VKFRHDARPTAMVLRGGERAPVEDWSHDGEMLVG
jgi:hypothetical protein